MGTGGGGGDALRKAAGSDWGEEAGWAGSGAAQREGGAGSGRPPRRPGDPP